MTRTTTIVLAVLAAIVLAACDRAVPPAVSATPTSETTPAAKAVVVTLAVNGMHCDGCASGIEAALAKVEGVRSCSVSYDENSARVEVDAPERTTSIIETIEGLGYEVAPVG